MTSRLVIRLGLFCLIVTALLVRLNAIEARERLDDQVSMTAQIGAIVAAAGFDALDNPVAPPRLTHDAVYFQRPDCPGVSIAAPYSFAVDAQAVSTRLKLDGQQVRHVYLDRDFASQSRPAFYVQWFAASLAGAVGLSPYLPLKIALLIAEPGACVDRQTPDWSQAWRLDARLAGGAQP